MIKIGLTGGIGCGKSTVTEAFARKGITIIDADKIAHEIVAPDTEALAEIIATFGNALLQQDGRLNRVALKKQVFSNANKLKQLEAILHPKIHFAIKEKLQQSAADSTASPYIIADVPLLIEKNYRDLFDQIIVVDCSPEQQIERVQQRDGLNIKIIQSIMAKQVSREQRLKQATHILDNSGSKESLLQQIDSLHGDFIRL